MRFDVKKYLFVGLEKDRDLFFKNAQEAGIIHFIDFKKGKVKELPLQVKEIAEAIKVLRSLPVVEQEETEDYEITEDITTQILGLKRRLVDLFEKERIVILEMSRVAIFGRFSLDDIAFIEKQGNRRIQFFCGKVGISENVDLPEEFIHIGTSHGLDYFISVANKNLKYPKMIEMFIEKPWNVLHKEHVAIVKEIHTIETHLKTYAKYNNFLHHAFVYKLNQYHLEAAKEFVNFPLENESLFVVPGWVAVNQQKALEELVKEKHVHVEEIAIDPQETVPTSLENEGFSRIGEDLVGIYDTPSMSDKDPSLWVLIFFALFFSMIINDGGYGLILLIIALYIRSKHSNLKGVKNRTLNLLTILGFSCVAWGLLTTSFFGIKIDPDSPLRHGSVMSWIVEKKAAYHIRQKDDVYQEWVAKYPAVKDVKDPQEFLMKTAKKNQYGEITFEAYNKFSDNILMELALFVGVLHLIISMSRYLTRNWSHLGWIIFLVGAYLYTPFFLHASSLVNFVFGINRDAAAHNGLYMVYGGAGLAVIIALFHHKWMGLEEASRVIQIFGDVLSYLRLYALGLAGAMLTETMNELSGTVPIVIGILILILGHVINVVLGVMGGVIHGLRLNFLEWYHYSFEGGGKPFNPLRKREIE